MDTATGRLLPAVPETPLEAYKVGFNKHDDPYNPMCWPMKKKIYTASILILLNFVAILGSAIISPGSSEVSKDFHVGSVVSTLACVSLFVLGIAAGPIVYGPMSEVLGRKIPFILSTFLFTCFAFASATAKDFQTFTLCRFFMGTSAACIVTLVPATIGDIFPPHSRGKILSVSVGAFMSGPMIGPIMGGYISYSYLRWRWTMYLSGIVSAFSLVLLVLYYEESYAPVVLGRKAERLRQETGVWPLFAPLERQKFSFKTILRKVLVKPIYLLVFEPILLLISIYMGFVYGIMYLCLSAVPVVFSDYGWHGGNVYLPYIGMLVGNYLITFINIVVFDPFYYRGLRARNIKIWPEGRLPAMINTSVTFPIGIFLFCWSGAYHVHWIVPSIGLAFIGMGITGMFMSGFNYVVETFLPVSASATAANTILRSAMGCAFPLFAAIMFHNLGTQWAGTLLGCLAIFLAPVPITFYIFGEKIRSLSRHTVKLDDYEEAPLENDYEDTKDREEKQRVENEIEEGQGSGKELQTY